MRKTGRESGNCENFAGLWSENGFKGCGWRYSRNICQAKRAYCRCRLPEINEIACVFYDYLAIQSFFCSSFFLFFASFISFLFLPGKIVLIAPSASARTV